MSHPATARDASSKSSYQVVDHSILLRLLKPYVWEPIAAHIPTWVSANTISIVGALSAVAALVSVMLTDSSQPGWYALASLFVAIYINLDNLDGAHARRTGRSAPMGEFIDHWMDTISSGIVIWAVTYAIQLPPWIIVALLCTNTLAFYATYLEQQTTGHMHMGMLGNLEGLVIVAVILAAVSVFGVEIFSEYQIFGLLTASWALAIWTMLQCAWTALTCSWRTRSDGLSWVALLLALGAAFAWMRWGEVPLVPVAITVVFCNSAFSGRRLVAHILKEPPRAGRSAALLVMAGAGLSLGLDLAANHQETLAWVVASLLMMQAAFDFVRTTRGRSQDLQPNEFLGWFFARSQR
ncbi:MAG: CDP-alcohol phosphatidyltransferase family protein [Myxococcales bacterium]|nr:CDP-alcohol phosphatidyltransferase family protein [Myxococcales bacterium]